MAVATRSGLCPHRYLEDRSSREQIDANPPERDSDPDPYEVGKCRQQHREQRVVSDGLRGGANLARRVTDHHSSKDSEGTTGRQKCNPRRPSCSRRGEESDAHSHERVKYDYELRKWSHDR